MMVRLTILTIAIARVDDDPYACPYLYTDGLSDELPFFAQARPRRMICQVQYRNYIWKIKTKIANI